MSLAFSVLTPSWLLHVSDAPNGRSRTARLQRHGAPAMLTWTGELSLFDALVDALQARAAHDPLDLARHIALEVDARNPGGTPGTALMAGWGVSPEGHRAGWRWKVTNHETDAEAPARGFQVEGTWLVPSYAQPGSKGKARAKVSYSAQVSIQRDVPESVQRGLERLERDLRKEPDPTDLATKLAAWVRETTGSPALLALLRPDGSLESGFLGDNGLTPATAADGDGIARIV